MTKFIDNTKRGKVRTTRFDKFVTNDLEVHDSCYQPEDCDTVEFIGEDPDYGDVFIAKDSEPGFTVFFGVKGSEFN